ncbi:MAG: chromosome segregation protein SMC [Acidimicrobiales bacterium]
MFLRSLSLKGFKSFADPTTLEFEPGVTVVVGPNGSGKSNVVDAIAWVLGAQGPSVVRSAKMDDVIFAGTAKRAALGRAEVTLTIDNSARRLPIELTEVTVTRTLFRSGESEYAINGSPCRLLDVQELLSDTGVGRQQHVVVGQGQLDVVLTAHPEDRRAIIEEAAGILKYRRRRERAQRRLEASEAGFSRVQDLLREVKRQLRPLERQATSARQHGELEAELGALRLHLAGRELAELSGRLAALDAQAAELDSDLVRRNGGLEALGGRLAAIEEELGTARADELAPIVSRLEQLRERGRGQLALVNERRRAGAALAAVLAGTAASDALTGELERVSAALADAETARQALAPELAALEAEEARLATRQEAPEDRFGADEPASSTRVAEARAARASSAEALRTSREAEVRATERAVALARRREELSGRLGTTTAELDRLGTELARAGAASETAGGSEAAAEASAASAEEALRTSTARRQAARARAEALELALDEARARAGMERLSAVSGVVGTLLDVVEVDDDLVLAFEAAVEGVLDAVLVQGGPSARAAVERLRTAGSGGSILPLLPSGAAAGPTPSVPPGAEALRQAVRAADPAVAALLDRLIGEVEVVRAGPEAVIERALADPGCTIVTPEGDRFSPFGWRIGAGRAGATRAALDAARTTDGEAARAVEHATTLAAEARRELAATRAAAQEARRGVDRLLGERASDETARAGIVRHLELVAEEEAAAAAEQAAAAAARQQAEQAWVEAEDTLTGVEQAEKAELTRASQAVAARREMADLGWALADRRRALEVRSAALEERASLLSVRQEALARQLDERRRLGGEDGGRAAADDGALERLATALAALLDRLDRGILDAAAERDRRLTASSERLARLGAARRERDELERALTVERERGQRLEIERTEARIREETAVERLRREFDVTAEEAMVAEAPELPPDADAPGRIRQLERELAALGPVNPLAAEELAALVDRRTFLEGQLDDVRSARRELNRVITAVDAQIVEAFTAAFADVERHFASLVATLFPGGSGRLHLTEPDDLLSTGVDIEARPAGRNIRRLSLLSGGERALLALGFLFAVFRSRPSPFYVLDEVEAALDDVNLGRFLDLVDEFRDDAQLLIVSHQKRTMEVADALYGISLQPGGASKVVSEKVDRRRDGERRTLARSVPAPVAESL